MRQKKSVGELALQSKSKFLQSKYEMKRRDL